MRDSGRWLSFLCGCFVVGGTFATKGAALAGTANLDEDALQFFDGSQLHGQLKEIDSRRGLTWESPVALQPMEFQPNHVDSIHFAHSSMLKLSPTCHIRFVNGDDLFGTLKYLDLTNICFTTWFGGLMSIPRASVQNVSFLSRNYSLVYEGPYDASGWVINQNLPGWSYRDGAFVSSGAGLFGRDLGLRGSATIEFDYTWSGMMDLMVQFYSDTVDRLDYNSNGYLVQFFNDQAIVRRLRANSVPRNLGTVPIPADPTAGTAHFTLQFNKDESSMALIVNDRLIKQWKDDEGFNFSGGGIVFGQQFPSVVNRLTNFRISSWEGRFAPETTAIVTNVDYLRLVNHDQTVGQIQSIAEGKLHFLTGESVLDVPLERITQLDFAHGTNASIESGGPWQVRARFPGGGSLSFELQQWTSTNIVGRSAVFGPLAFEAGAIRELDFNLGRTTGAAKKIAVPDVEGLDE